MKKQDICVIIPVYNSGSLIYDVIKDFKKYIDTIIVINDGSTDDTEGYINKFSDEIEYFSYSDNRGKGYALKYGFTVAYSLGYKYAVTVDADGQHLGKDLPKIINAIVENPNSIIVGVRDLGIDKMPGKSTFANKFSNFWFTVETGLVLQDTQTGYRAYNLEKVIKMSIWTSRYEAELELLITCAWRNVKIVEVPIDVYYPEPEDRVSHFRPLKDFTRISILNTCFVFLAIFYGYPSRFIRKIFTNE